jgi:hypothetical protein
MSLTQQDRDSLAKKDELDDDAQLAIDGATRAAMNELVRRGFAAAFDDRSARLEAAVVRFFLESQGAR